MDLAADQGKPFVLAPEALSDLCPQVRFSAGDRLREKGLHYLDMYLITQGEVAVDLGIASAAPILLGPGSPIGEIGFLTGIPATATVTARTNVAALFIDNPIWRILERKKPELAVSIYRQLSDVAEGRQSYNLSYEGTEQSQKHAGNLEIILCQRRDDLFEAQRIRYQIYCGELGRTSPYADAEKQTIADELDETAHVLLAFENGKPVATLRMNKSRDGGLGVLEKIYGMESCPSHPRHTAVCTKFIAKREARMGSASFRLMATGVELARRHEIEQCYIDCIPSLLPFYKSLGFAQSAEPFLHRENGRSYPMSLDINRYAKRISRLTGFVSRS